MSAESLHPTDALLALVYGELGAEEARTVQRHVDGCSLCAETVGNYRAVRAAASSLPREMESSPGLDSLLHYGAQAAGRARRRRGLRLLWPVLAGAVAVWVVVVAVRPPAQPELAAVPAATQPTAGGPLSEASDKLLAKKQKADDESAPVLAQNEAVGTAAAPRAKRQMAAPSPPAAAPAPEPAKREAQNAAPTPLVRRMEAPAAAADRVSAQAAPAPPAEKGRADLAQADARARDASGSAAGAYATGTALGSRGASVPKASAEAKAGGVASSAESDLAVLDGGASASEANLARKSVAGSPLAPMGKEALPMLPGVAAPAAPTSVAGGVAGASVVSADGGVSASRSADQARRATLYVRLRESRGAQLLPVLFELCGLEARLGHVQDAVGFCQRVMREYPGTPEAAAAQRQIELLRGG